MVLKLYNTLTRKKETFKSVKKGKVSMYVCGPTVNDVPHLGHARQQICFDVLRRYLIFLDYKVKFVSNITDIEDKIINKANELNISIKELTEKNYKKHTEDYQKIKILKPDYQPFATKYIEEMIQLIKNLEKEKYVYIIENDGVYYDISKFKDYGKLSHQDINNLKSGIRVKGNESKKNKQDFVLWKFSKQGEPTWNSPWGKGRPGWHIECSAMSKTILGLPIDIHGGGQDLIFPHHEDEIAQSEAGYKEKFANYWIHNGMVNVNNVKMSKSLGNFKTIEDILKKYKGEIVRYFVLSTQYRKPVDFSEKTLENAKSSYDKLKNIISNIEEDEKTNDKSLKEFEIAMNDDLNTPKALQSLWKLIKNEKAVGKLRTIKKMDGVFGLKLLEKEKVSVPKEVKDLVKERKKARREKNFKKADELRNKINKKGYVIDDTQDGAKVKLK